MFGNVDVWKNQQIPRPGPQLQVYVRVCVCRAQKKDSRRVAKKSCKACACVRVMIWLHPNWITSTIKPTQYPEGSCFWIVALITAVGRIFFYEVAMHLEKLFVSIKYAGLDGKLGSKQIGYQHSARLDNDRQINVIRKATANHCNEKSHLACVYHKARSTFIHFRWKTANKEAFQLTISKLLIIFLYTNIFWFR